MTQLVFKSNVKISPRRMILPIQVAELRSPTEEKKSNFFAELEKKRWWSSINPPENMEVKLDEKDYKEYQNDAESLHEI